MQLYLVRHGESIGNTKKGFIAGRSDPEGLSKKGRSQIIRTAWDLRGEKFDRIYVSPVHRAQETASILNLYLQSPLQEQDWLTELHHGLFEGNFWWEVTDKVPPEWRKKRENYETPYPGGGESMKDLVERVWKGYSEFIKGLKENEKVILVSHQAVITALIYVIQYGDPTKIQTEEQKKFFLNFMHNTVPGNGSITKVTYHDEKPKIEEIKNQFPPVEISKESICFYAQGLIGSPHSPKLEHIPTSSGNAVYRVHVDDKKFILKIYKNSELISIQRLVKVYRYLECCTEITAPKVVHYEKSNVFFRQATLMQDYLTGEEQSSCLEDHPTQAQSIFRQIKQVLDKVHAIPTKDVAEFWFPDDWEDKSHPSWNDYIKREILFTSNKLGKLNLPDEIKMKMREKLEDLFYHIKKSQYPLVPLHGDLSPHNFVIHHEKGKCNLVRILDFERGRIGDKLWDYVYYYGWLERIDEKIARLWKDCIWKSMDIEEQIIFSLYRILFHAWTARDMIDYEDNDLRKKRGEKSIEILKEILR